LHGENPGQTLAPKITFLLLAIALLLAVLNLSHLWIQTSNPQETTNPESLFILHAADLSEGKPLYTDFRHPPYNVTQYTPLHYAILAVLKRIFSLDLQQLFYFGRRLILTSAVWIGIGIFLHGKKETAGNSLSFIAAFLFLGSYVLWPFACTNRPDVLAVLLSIAAVLLITRNKNLFVAVVLLVLAFYAKQSFLSAPAAIALYFLINRQFPRLIQFIATYVVVTSSIWIWLHVSTNGMSTLNLVEANLAPMKLQNIRLVCGQFLQQAALPMILSFAALTKDRRKELIPIYFGVSMIWAILTSAKLGSNTNYFIEPLAAGCLLIPGYLKQEHRPALLAAIFVILAIPQINFLAHTLNTIEFKHDYHARKISADATGLVISDNPRIALESKHPFFLDPYVYSYLEIEGKLDSSKLVTMIKDGKVQYLILLAPLDHPLTWQGVTRLPATVITSCSEEFRQAKVVDGYFIYVRK
jgi:hypothetical protein